MTQFDGFPAGKIRQIPIPAQFFTELLPDIDQIGELKLSLYIFWRLSKSEGNFRYIRRAEMEADKVLLAGLSAEEEEAQSILAKSVEASLLHGFILESKIQIGEKQESIFFLNSPRGRAAIQAIEKGVWNPVEEPPEFFTLDQEEINIYRLYEDNIGPLNPMIAETLDEAQATYPDRWIVDAVRIAVENNVRRWRYVEAILQNWSEEGKDERRAQGDSEEGRQRYIRGEFSEFIEH